MDIQAILEWNDAGLRAAAEIERHPLVTSPFECRLGRLLKLAAASLRKGRP